MRKLLALPLIFAFIIWTAATLFFVLLGEKVLAAPNSDRFLLIFLLLELGTALLLTIVFLIYKQLDKSPFAPLKLGVTGTAIGLFMDTWSLWNKDWVFANLSEGQIASFTIWMAFAYGLFLTIPLLFMRKQLLNNNRISLLN